MSLNKTTISLFCILGVSALYGYRKTRELDELKSQYRHLERVTSILAEKIDIKLSYESERRSDAIKDLKDDLTECHKDIKGIRVGILEDQVAYAKQSKDDMANIIELPISILESKVEALELRGGVIRDDVGALVKHISFIEKKLGLRSFDLPVGSSDLELIK